MSGISDSWERKGEFIVIFRRVPSATDEVLLPPRVATASEVIISLRL